ncbi:MAG: AAA family ATPase [Planctomycetes bacterium]|nr:AAA family ATPase [Planctomycetota bacterium]
MTKSLENITVHRFRGLRELVLNDLGTVNLFVGPNNAGKTSVLEAVSTCCHPLDPLEWLNTVRRREIKSSREPLLDALKWLFPQSAGVAPDALYTGTTRITANGTFPLIESCASYTEVAGSEALTTSEPYISSTHTGSVGDEPDEDEEDDEESSESYEGVQRGAELELRARVQNREPTLFESDKESDLVERFQLWENERFVSHKRAPEPHLPVATVTPFSHRVEQLQLRQLSGATESGTKEHVLEVIRLLDPGVQDLDILARQGIRPTLHLWHSEVGLSPLSAFGDGVRRTLMMAMSLIAVRGGVLLIDEIETAIHKSALGPVFRWLVEACRQYNVQLFATTHSLEAVDAILQSLLSDPTEVVGYRLEQTDQATTAKRYDGEMLHRLRHERGLDVR